MPVPKRYFHCSQELNLDPELWTFTDTFGDRALRTWLQILIFLERSDNKWRLVDGWEKSLARLVRQQPKTVSAQVEELRKNGWLVILEPEKNHSSTNLESTKTDSITILASPNWLKYNKRREHEGISSAPSMRPSLPIPSVPLLKNKKKSMPLRADGDDSWIEDLKKNAAYQHINFAVEFGKMDAWFSLPSHKHRKRTKAFVLNWLNKIEIPMQPQQTTSYRPTKVVL